MRRGILGLIPAPVLIGIAMISSGLGAYYCAAQSLDLPGAISLRERWQSTTRRGLSGHRSRNPRPNGPLDLTLLGGIAVVTSLRGFKLHRSSKNQGTSS